MSAVQITGCSGAGKSTIAGVLARRGLAAIDADNDPCLARMVDAAGNLAEEAAEPDFAWLARHSWTWNPGRLDELIQAAAPATLYVCGGADNELELAGRFSQVFLLEIDEPTMLARLDARRDYHDWGRIGDTREYLRRKLPQLQDRLRASGAIPIDAREPLGQVVDAILARVGLVNPKRADGTLSAHPNASHHDAHLSANLRADTVSSKSIATSYRSRFLDACHEHERFGTHQANQPVHRTRGQEHKALEEEDEAMAIFKRRSPDNQDKASSATAQNQPSQQYGYSGTDPQYQDQGGNPQYQDQGGNPQYQGQGGNPQYQDPQRQGQGRSPQYQDTGRTTQYERTRTDQAVATPRYPPPTPRGLPGGWLGEMILGLAVVVLGLIIAAHPMHSLNVLAILLGVAMVVAGVYHVVHSLRRAGDHRMWGAIAGVVFFLVGIFFLRHVSLTVALIALFAGFAFIIAGIAALAEAISGHDSMGRLWSALLGVICVFAGTAAIVSPSNTLARLAILLGWALFAIGVLHIIRAIVSWRTLREESRREREQISVPGQRSTDVEGAHGAPTEAQTGASSTPPRHRRSRL